MKLRKLDIKITDAISKMGRVFHGMFIDGYNRSASDIAGCIHTRINEGNYWFVIEMNEKIKTDVVGLLCEGKWAKMHELSRRVYGTDGIAPTIHTCGGGNLEPKIKEDIKIRIIGKRSPNSESNGNVYDADGLSPTTLCGAHGGCEPRIRVGAIRGRVERNRQTLEVKDEMATNTLTSVQKDNILISDFRSTICLNSKVDGKQPSLEHRMYSDEGCATAVTTSFMPSISTNFRIRKLTERECFRLMGVRENDIDKLLKAGISKTQLYKLAGNSIVCDVLMAIFDKMFVNTNAEKGQQLSLF